MMTTPYHSESSIELIHTAIEIQENIHFKNHQQEEILEDAVFKVLREIIDWANFTCSAINHSSIQLEPDHLPYLEAVLEDLKDMALPF